MSGRRLLAAVLLLIPLLIAVGIGGTQVIERVTGRTAPDLAPLAAATRDMDAALAAWADNGASQYRDRFVTREAMVEAALRDLEESSPSADWTDLKLELSTDLAPLLLFELRGADLLPDISAAVHGLAVRVEHAAATRRQSEVGLAAGELRQRLIEIRSRGAEAQ